MGQTAILYTAIPDATHTGPGLRITVAIAPRLAGPAGALFAEFPELHDWPARLGGLLFEVELGGGLIAPAQLVPPRTGEEHDVDLWRRIFPMNLPVNTWEFVNYESRTFHEFPATAINARLLDVYGQVARSGITPPRVLDVGDLAHCAPPVDPHDGGHDPAMPCDVSHYTPTVVDRLLLDYEAAAAAIVDPSREPWLTPDERAIYRGLRFYRRGTDADIDGPVEEPSFDLHQRAALLADHPVLQRRCGLVFDLFVPFDLSQLPPSGELRVRPRWRGYGNPLDLCPFTLYETSTGRLRAASNGAGVLTDGYLDLARNELSVIQLDGDGALLNVATTMASIRRLLTDPHTPPEHEQTLPALRSGGVTLVHRDRGAWLADRLNVQSGLHVDPQLSWLHAEDLVRGWRLDVRELGANGPGPWRSLHRRHGAVFGTDDDAPAFLPIPASLDDEGYVKAASGTSPTFRPDELYLHEAVAGWTGWSLSARRPGMSLEYVPPVIEGGAVVEAGYDRAIEDRNHRGSMPVRVEYQATSRSLPRLRFGRDYELRARAVDLAGASLKYDDPGVPWATLPFRFERFEPVPPPVILQQTAIREAESLEHMVVRTDPAGARSHDTTVNRRHVLAPKASLDQWEKHGMLDAAFPVATQALYDLACREGGTLLDPGAITIDDLELCNPPSNPATPTWPAERGAPLGEGQYVICTGERVRLPWLPDPMSAGIVLWDPTGSVSPVIRRFRPRADAGAGLAAVDLDSILIVLHATAAGTPPSITPGSETDREIHVHLPPGDKLELRYASLPDDETLPSMALWHLLTGADHANLDEAIKLGQHWMFTPSRPLTLVHAAQRPVVGPTFAAPLTATRVEGEARAHILTDIRAHGHSTSQVDVRARWYEVQDDGDLGATAVIAESDAFRVPFAYDDTVVPVARVTEIIERLPQTTSLGPLLAIRRRLEGTNTYQELTNCKRVICTYTAIGTTRWQEYFPLSVLADPTDSAISNLQTVGETHRAVSIPASIAPDVPHVAQVLPTFQRTGTPSARTRRGNGIRIYLERPWFTSGVGERLAILIGRPTTPVDWADKVSRWAADPVWTRPAPHPRPLSTDAFVVDPTDTVPAFGGLDERPRVEVVPGINGLQLDAIVVEPAFNAERQQWYCDVELTGASYFPFLSLALARYQDDAVGALKLSGVVRAELVQLAPDRTASITVSPNGRRVTVRVRGVSAGNLHEPQHTAAPGGAHRVYVRVEKPKASGDPLDWAIHDEGPLTPAWANADEVEWTGVFRVRPTLAWRVVIEERQVFAGADHGSGQPPGERISYVEILTPS